MDTTDLKQKASELVKDAFRVKLEEATQQRLSVFEGGNKPLKEEEDEADDADDSDEESDEDGEDTDEESDNEDPIEEALKVHALPVTERGKGTKMRAEEMSVKDMRELTRLAKTSKYDYFTVEKKNGDVEEYSVENGKLVLM